VPGCADRCWRHRCGARHHHHPPMGVILVVSGLTVKQQSRSSGFSCFGICRRPESRRLRCANPVQRIASDRKNRITLFWDISGRIWDNSTPETSKMSSDILGCD
jgi:hypothetical protein